MKTTPEYLEGENAFRNIFDQSPVGSALIGKDKCFIKCNQALCAFLGYTEKELIGKSIADVTHPEDVELGLEEMKMIGRGSIESSTIQKRYLRKDGTSVWGEVTFSLIRDKDNNPLYLVPVIQDISKRKLAENEAAAQRDISLKINRFSIELSLLAMEENIGELIVKSIREFTGAEIASFSVYDPSSRTLTVQHFEMESGIMQRALNLIGKKGKDIHAFIPDEVYGRITTEVIGVRRSLYDACFGAVSRPVGAALQSLLKVDRFIGLAHIIEGELYGTTLIGLRADQPDLPASILESFVLIVAGTLRRRKGNEALLESEENYRQLIENSHDIIYTLTVDGVITFVSKAWTSLLGHLSADVIGQPFQSYLHPDDVVHLADKLNTYTLTGILPERVEYRVMHKDGTWRWHSSNPLPILGRSGKVAGFEGTARDITDRKHAEGMVAQTRWNYETFFNTIDEFLFVLDEKANIIHANKTVFDRLGYSEEELIGQSVLLIHPPERRAEAAEIVGKMIRGEAEFCPVPLLSKSGIQIAVETRVSPGSWDGRPAIFGVTKDISQLRLSEERFSKVFFVNPSACGLTDQETLQYTEVNEAFFQLFGFNKDEVIGKTPMELGILTDDAREVLLRKADIHGNVNNLETMLKAKNGDIKQVLLSSENIYVQERKFRFTVVQDITERKNAEAEIKIKNEKLQKLISENNRFYSIIAHDLRSPFNALLGLTKIMAEDLPRLTLEELQKIALTMRQSANNLYSLLENLLEWSGMQTGLTGFNPEPMPLMEGIVNNMDSVMVSADKKEIRISYEVPPDIAVIADPYMFGSCIRNLAFNAVKFTPRGGKIIIRAKDAGDEMVEISVSDNGIGITGDTMGKLFRIDVQTTHKGTEGEPSTGLGLILCRDFIEKMGGTIRVESDPGVGSTFCFTLVRGNRPV